jgi:hypothetical protein
MIPVAIALALAIVGVAIFLCAKHLSDFEKRLREGHPWTKVTGWSGTSKGVWSWRFVGVLVILLSLLIALESQIR